MGNNMTLLQRKTLALFNFLSKSKLNKKNVGELSFKDIQSIVKFLTDNNEKDEYQISANEIVSDVLKEIESSPNKELWNSACYFLNQLVGLNNLTLHEERYTRFYWQSLLTQSLLLRHLDETKKMNQKCNTVVTKIINRHLDIGDINDN